MTLLRTAALAALLTVPATLVAADDFVARKVGGTPVSFKRLEPGSVLLSLATQGRGQAQAPKSQASSGTKRTVIVDGVLMELDEEIIRGQIANGVFIVVYPGTNIPWSQGDNRHPNYPPDWFGA